MKATFFVPLVCFAVLLWQPAVAQMSSLPACTAVDDTDNDGVDSTIDVDKDGDGLIEICDLEGINEMRYQLDGSGYKTSADATTITQGCPPAGCKGYELMRSLDFNVADSYRGNMVDTTWTTSTGWQPIGSNANRFSSIFEGNGHTISNLYVSRIAEASLGLFSVVDTDGEVNNVGLLNVSVEGSESNIGGVVGLNYGRITNSYATGAVTGTGENVGGLVGSNGGDIMNSYATGTVTGTGDNIGGLVGSNGGDIMNSYATGAVTGNSGVGGLVGSNRGSVTDSYAMGAVIGNSNVGGLVGSNRGSVTNSYWNTQTSGLATSAGGDGVTSATTVQLQSPTAPGTTPTEVYYGWSSDDWDFGTPSQYPILKKSDGTLLSPTLRYGLSQLRLAKGHLSPDFISIIPNYTGSVVVDTNTIQLIPIAINANARIHITGRGTQEIASGATSEDIMLNEDGITTITIIVMTAGISIEYNFNLRYYQYSGDVDIDNDGLIEIDNIEDLSAIRYQPDGTGYKKGTAPKITTGCPSTGCKGYELTKSLSFAEDSDWSPIALFSGIFEGNGYTISKLRINKPNASNLGLFSSITSGAKINNIGLLDIDIQGDSFVSGLVGINYGRITNSYTTGAVTGNGNVGGLVGENYGRITNSYATGAVTGTGDEVGGLVGDNDGRVTNSYAMGAVTGNGRVGGLVGINGGRVTNSYATGVVTGTGNNVGGLVGSNGEDITNSYATGVVTGTGDNVGGLVGSNSGSVTDSYVTGAATGISGVGGLVGLNGGSVTNSYVTGAVTGINGVGGLVGINGSRVTDSYVTGAVTGISGVGGLVGINGGRVTDSYAMGAVTGINEVGGLVGTGGGVTNSYWNTQTSGLTKSDGGEGKTTAELQLPTTTTGIYSNWSTANWDFGTSSQYPILKKSDGTLLSPTLRYGLSQLRLANGHLSPDFISIIPNYTGSVVVDTNTIQLIPIAINANARIHITGRGTQEIASGATSEDVMLNEDGITTITIVVMTAGISIEYNFNLRYYQYSGDIDIDNDGLIEIDNIEDLNAIRYQLDGTGYKKGTAPKITTGCPSTGCKGYELTKSLSFAEDSDWSPIALFSGIFEGNGYTISKLTINKPNASNLGLFSSITSGAKINNIGLLDIDIQGDSFVSGLVGINYGRITNSYTTGAVTGNGNVGGLVSENYGRITNSYATGAVTGGQFVGGLVGENNGRITNSYATGAVTGRSGIGGLAGSNNGDITNSYATGAVTGISGVGGLVGVNYNNGSVTNSYAMGAVTGTGDNVGGLVGDNGGSVTNSYWNTQTSGLATSAGGDGVTSATTAQLRSPTAPGTTTTEVYYGWSSDDWDFGTPSQYPILKKSDGTLLSPTLRYGLSQLRLAQGHLSPDFISIIPNYTGSVVVDTNTIQLIPIAINANARIHITGRGTQEIASGATSDDIMLNEEGITTITIIVMTAGISIEYNFNLRYYQYSGDVDIDNDGLIEIDNIEDLNAIRYQPDGTGYKKGTAPKITTGCPLTGCKGYELTKSLSFAEDNDWSPIALFSGIFEGNGYTISKLTINKPNANSVGFFSSITSGAKINNIGLLDIDIQGDSRVGGLVGLNYGRITNSYAMGTVTGNGNVGSLVGDNRGRITNSYATGTVTGTGDNVGGLVGANRVGSVTNSYATGTVTGNNWVGGLVGANRVGSVTNSYATGTVTGNNWVGGLVGANRVGSVTNSYWNTQTSGLATSAGGDGVTSATTAQLQSPTAPGTMTTEIYYGWSSDDWDFGDNSHYPALRHARGDGLNACNPDITTPSAILACAVPLPNQRDRNQGLTALFVLADGDDVTAELIPTFFPLKSSYDTIIATTETAVQLTLRPYAINNNATITITDQDNADYFAGKPSGALSDPIMLSDSITLTLLVTDTIDEATVNTTYTFIIRREDPLEILEITIESATNADGTINEASMASILFDVVGGVGSYRYEYKIIVGTEEILLSQSEPPVELTIPDNIVAIESTQQTIELNIIVRDSVGQTIEYREALTIQKVDNGVAELDISRETSRTLIALMGADPDGAIDDSAYQWQWRGPAAAAQWMDLESATSTSYTITDELAVVGNEFRIQVAYTDGQGYHYDALYSKAMKYDLLPRCALAIADRDDDDVDSSIDVDKDGDGLIELCDLEGIDEMRYQPDGRGYQTSDDAINIMRGCPLVDGEEHCRGYELMRSLDFNAADSYRNHTTSSKWTTASGWLPLVANYSAVFEGNGHSISGLYIARTEAASGSEQGLFSTLAATAQIKNIRLLDVNIQGLSAVGALASRNSGIIINSSVSGAVEATADVGGLVGINDGHIISSFADVAVSATTNSGGLVGRNQGLMTNSYASGNVTASGDNIGGLVGLNNELGRIINTYAEGTVRGASQVGGLVGSHHGMIMNSYATIGGVSGSGSHLGGLIGMASSIATVIASYWDTERSGIESSGGGSGKTTAELQTPIAPGTTITEVYYRWNTSDWDFGDSKHYPALRYASAADPDICTTDITTSSVVLPCTLLLPDQHGRDKGLAEVFFFTGGEAASVILTPLFTPLTDSYDMTIIIPENTDPEMQLRPYAINDNAMIMVTELGSATDYYAGKSNSELSDVIEWDGDATTLTVIVTDVVDGDPANTTYTFAVTRVVPLDIAEISVTPSGIVDEGSDMTITFTVSDGKGEYEYAYALDGEPLSSPSQPLLQFTIPTTLVASDRTTQTVEVNIIVSDDIQIIEHPLALIVRKIDNGDDFSLSSEVSQSQLSAIFAGTDADGEGVISYQWQQLALGGEWTNIAAATTPTYHLPDDTDGSIRYRVNVQHTDGQGYVTHYQQGPFKTGDIDNDDDGLIEIYYLEDVNAMRYQLDGSGYKTSMSALASMHGCPDLGCSGYELMRSLDFNADVSYQTTSNKAIWTAGAGWLPIGLGDSSFSSVFEGNGHTISNLYIKAESRLGLFSVLHNGRIQNVGLLDAEVEGTGGFIGGLIGLSNLGSVIINSYVTGNVTGMSDNVTRMSDNVGGLVGFSGGSIINSYAKGVVTGSNSIGGLVGWNADSIINSYATGVVTGSNSIGGLVGWNADSIINSYATGVVTGIRVIGGLVGGNINVITNSYATGVVTGNSRSGGLVGFSDRGIITASYWDTEKSGIMTSAAGIGKTTDELQSPTVATGIYSGWSSDDWDFGDSNNYPTLRYAKGGNLNACTTEITTASAVLPCGIALPNPSDSDLNKGLAGIFFFADGEPASGVLDPIFSQLIYNYDMTIVSSDLDIQLRPYALNDNAAISINKGNTNYFSDDRPNGALSSAIRLVDNETTLTLVITDIIDEIPVNTTYTFVIERLLPVQVNVSLARFSIILEPATPDPDGAGVFSYQWQQQVPGSGWTDIPDATTATYWLPADVDGSIRYRLANIKHTDGEGYETIYPPQGPFRASVDDDGDGLIDIYYLQDMDAMRYQLNGRAYQPDKNAELIMRGCPATGCKGYELMRSLDFNVADSYQDNTIDTTWTTSTGWQPIGSDTNRFSGIFEGNGHTIANLFMDRTESNLGLFSVLHTNGKIQNIGLLDAEVEGTEDVISGLVSINYGAIINSYATGEITGTDHVGGLVGFSDGSIINSYATGTVTGGSRVGGLVGSNNGDITNSYATGDVSGRDHVGGLVGDNNSGSIINSYATGLVRGNSNFGRVGGLIGVNSGSVTASYWNAQTSDQLTSAGDNGVTSATTAQLQSPTAPGMTTTEVYYGWSSDDWDFGDNSHYPALRYARGDDLNACTPDITTSSAVLLCQVPLSNQSDRNQGLAALFLLADGNDVTAQYIPTFFPLKSNYNTFIVSTATDIQLILRPYTINANATITITDQDNRNYFAGKPNGALSDVIRVSDSLTVTVVVTDTIAEGTTDTIYILAIRKMTPLEVLEVTVSLPAAHADGMIDEGSHTTITYTVSGGSGIYEYAYKIDDGALTQSSPSFVYRAPFNLVASDATTQAVSITIRISDQDESVEVLEHREVLTIRKVNNGVAELVVSRATTTMTVTVGSDVDGDPDPSGYNYQWQSRALGTDSEWTNIMSATDATYTIPENVSGEFRVQVTYTDRQGYDETLASDVIEYIAPSQGIKIRAKVFLEGPLR